MFDTNTVLFVHMNDKWLPVTGLCTSDELATAFCKPDDPNKLEPVIYIGDVALMVNMNKAQADFDDAPFQTGAQEGPKMYVRPPYIGQHDWFAVRGSFTSANKASAKAMALSIHSKKTVLSCT